MLDFAKPSNLPRRLDRCFFQAGSAGASGAHQAAGGALAGGHQGGSTAAAGQQGGAVRGYGRAKQVGDAKVISPRELWDHGNHGSF